MPAADRTSASTANAWNSQSANRRAASAAAARRRASGHRRAAGPASTACTAAVTAEVERRRIDAGRCARRRTLAELDLTEREPERRLDVEIGREVPDPAHHADDLPLAAKDVHVRAEGIAAREVAAGQRIVDDQRERLPDRIAGAIEEAPARGAACPSLRNSRGPRPDSARPDRRRRPAVLPTMAKPVFSS